MSLITYQHGSYPDLVGRRSIFAGNYVGPASYTNTANIATTGDPVQVGPFNYYIDAIHATVSVSGTYLVRFRPSGPGPRATWKAVWVTISTGNEVTNATNLSAETVIVSGFGGLF